LNGVTLQNASKKEGFLVYDDTCFWFWYVIQ